MRDSITLVRTFAPLAAFCAVAGCSRQVRLPDPIVALTEPTTLCTEPDDDMQACLPAEAVSEWFARSDLKILQSAPTPGGTQGASVVTLALGDGMQSTVFRAKWRSFATGDLVNDPRKELGAFAVQQLFLTPPEYVIPPTAAYCFPLDEYRRSVDSSAEASFQLGESVCGILSYWLPNARDIDAAEDDGLLKDDTLVDARLFARSPGYRRAVANLNIVTYLIRHGDAHNHQFMLTTTAAGPRPYTVDNSISFESIQNPMLVFREDWSDLRVDTLPARTVARLEQLSITDLLRLEAISQFTVENRRLRRSAVGAAEGDVGAGLRWIGTTIQIGLTESEIDGVWARLRALLERVKSGKLKVFARYDSGRATPLSATRRGALRSATPSPTHAPPKSWPRRSFPDPLRADAKK